MSTKTHRPRLVISVGCPSGVGPEVSVAAAARWNRSVADLVLVGDVGALRDAARVRGLDPERLSVVRSPVSRVPTGHIRVIQPSGDLRPRDRIAGKPSLAGGAAQLGYVDVATDLVVAGEADALVTGPVSKDAIHRSGARGARAFRGHTEHLAARLGADEVTMAFATDKLVTSLVTTHLPLAKVPRAITEAAVGRAVFWTGHFISSLARARRVKRNMPMAVAALNPHAGEGGLLGREEETTIGPGIAIGKSRLLRARIRDVSVIGPVPAETAFRLAADGAYSAVVAMYHDQATIPMKLLGFGEAVNVSLGLPIIRTSVDHGTAYDRAGKGIADERGMMEALSLAATLAIARR